jgi:hypothetical protein
MTQFKAGISGNPRGRPKGKRSSASALSPLHKQIATLLDELQNAAEKGNVQAAAVLLVLAIYTQQNPPPLHLFTESISI